MDKLICDRAKAFDPLDPVEGNMHVEHLAWLYGEIAFDSTAVEFEIQERGHGSVNGSDMLDLVGGLKDDKFLVVLTGRWFAFPKNGERYYLFNCHPVREDAEFDESESAPGAIFEAESANAAVNILKKFGVVKYAPFGLFAVHAIVLNPKKSKHTITLNQQKNSQHEHALVWTRNL